MNSDNQSGQISLSTRIIFCGVTMTKMIHSLSRKGIYELAFYNGDEDGGDEYCINTTIRS